MKLWRSRNPDKVRGYFAKWKAENPERFHRYIQVAKKVHYAIKTGKIVRPDRCEQCGVVGSPQAAHADYSKPFDIRWLCALCHTTWDRVPKTV